jgi:hypothetical protein
MPASPRAHTGMLPAPGTPVLPQRSRKHSAGLPPVYRCQAAARVPYAACLASIAGLVLLYWAPDVKEPG